MKTERLSLLVAAPILSMALLAAVYAASGDIGLARILLVDNVAGQLLLSAASALLFHRYLEFLSVTAGERLAPRVGALFTASFLAVVYLLSIYGAATALLDDPWKPPPTAGAAVALLVATVSLGSLAVALRASRGSPWLSRVLRRSLAVLLTLPPFLW